MAFNLIESVRNQFGTDFIGRASSMLGESEHNVQKGISGIIPTVLTGILQKSGSGEAGNVLGMAKDAADTGLLSNVSNIIGNNNLLTKGANWAKSLFGNRADDVTNAVSSYAGVKPSSAAMLMSTAAPVALGVLGKHAKDSNMSASGMQSFLEGQKDSIINAVPSELNLARALGIGSLSGIGGRARGAVESATTRLRDTSTPTDTSRRTATEEPERRRRSAAWVLPLILALVALGAIWYFTRDNRRDREREIASPQPSTTTVPAPAPAGGAATMESISVSLPDGNTINAKRGGIEDKLVSLLNNPSATVDENTWFDFDQVNFESGSARLTPESDKQLDNLAAILKAFPNAAIKVGGYTDKTGNEEANKRLSQQRAEAVVAALKQRGVKESQLMGAEGYGSQFAKADANAPDEERKKDRRMAVSVRKK